MNQGRRANKNGDFAENTIDSILRQKRYWPERQWYVGKSIYDHDLRADFFIPDVPGFPAGLIIESKWQDAGGSVDEKFPYLVLNIRECYPCPTIVIAGGGGAKPGALRWLRSQVDTTHLYAVFTLEEFLSWAMRNL